MNAPTSSRDIFAMTPDSRPATSNKSYRAYAPYTHTHQPHHVSELSALPRSPEEHLTPPDSDPFKSRCIRDPAHNYCATPLTPIFNTQDGKAQLIAEQEWQITQLNCQRAINKESIARLEAERDQVDRYYQQRVEHHLYTTQQWSVGITEIARLNRCIEERTESANLELEKHIRDSNTRENRLRQHNGKLVVEIERMEAAAEASAVREEQSGVRMAECQAGLEKLRVEKETMSDLIAELSRRERQSEESNRATVVERDIVDARKAELESTVTRLNSEACKFWRTMGSLLAILVMLVVIVESC